jgi:cysteinyl-tRNA synthetase
MIRLYDTMSREKREFEPLNPEGITMYVCGPTVYNRAHIGNARPAVVFDTLARLIRHEYGPNSLVYARNVTDVDDKIIAAAEAEGVEPAVITERYERAYLEDMGALGVEPPTIAPHATREIEPMIAMIERLIGLGHAYEAEGHVLFSVPSDPTYGALSRRDREAMLAGARVEVAPYKRDPADFVLWKPSGDGVIGWDSPWGRGRPGWHIECSAMIRAHLGETIDIHGGGLDLIFPHHENEIAQSRCAHGGAPLARFWVHNGFLDMGAEKMSKSLGNVVTVDQLLQEGWSGEALRLALLSKQYRQPLEWAEWLIEKMEEFLSRARDSFRFLDPDSVRLVSPPSRIVNLLRDDLNTGVAIDFLQSSVRKVRAAFDMGELTYKTLALETLAGFQLLGIEPASLLRGFDADIEEARIEGMILERADAKKNRDFATADRIRDELKAEGIVLEDTPSGTTWRRE